MMVFIVFLQFVLRLFSDAWRCVCAASLPFDEMNMRLAVGYLNTQKMEKYRISAHLSTYQIPRPRNPSRPRDSVITIREIGEIRA